MATVITALIVLGSLALIIGLLMFVHRKDQKNSRYRTRNHKIHLKSQNHPNKSQNHIS
jgi:predicted histidine transporter YuiF (NhaC family)